MAHRRGHRPILVCGVDERDAGPAATEVAYRDDPTGRYGPGRPVSRTALPRRQGAVTVAGPYSKSRATIPRPDAARYPTLLPQPAPSGRDRSP